MVQELLSAQRTPMLSVILPLYEKLIHELTAAKKDLPKISHAIGASVAKLKEYLSYARKNRVYVLAMGIKLNWLEKHWSATDFANAKSVIHAAMLEYQQTNCKVPLRRTVSLSLASSAAYAQASGLNKFSDIRQRNALRQSQIQSSTSPAALASHSSTPSLENLPTSPESHKNDSSHQELEEDLATV
ncbi:hypothetical protein C8R41DRAFT_869713 [Lentinula lateritia]|uniref:Uncharacterized protein n=1 Tax=Lentinula lateritia TaxID=40482 RepID=A0ABQ8VAI7_9AGAR|nr:hypothetical protein C8R41DRAFT_869713 [Lentinula lateritia]